MSRCVAIAAIAATCLQVAVAADSSPTPAPTFPTPGGWNPVNITDRHMDKLAKALQNETAYPSGISTRLCFQDILTAEEQVVAGFNLRFETKSCVVKDAKTEGGKCAAKCDGKGYFIQIFDNILRGSVEVKDIIARNKCE